MAILSSLKNLKYILCFALFASMFACGKKAVLGEPIVKCGISTISGQLVLPNGLPPNSTVTIIVMNPITMGSTSYKVMLNENGKFKQQVETELNLALCAVYFSTNPYQTFMIPILKDDESRLQVIYKQDGSIEDITLLGEYTLSNYDIEQGYNLLNIDFVNIMGKDTEPLCNMSSSEFAAKAENRINDQISQLHDKLEKLSPNIQAIDIEDAKIMEICWTYFDYVKSMEANCKNLISSSNSANINDSINIEDPSIEYYSFLKTLNLESPLYLYASSTPMLFENILNNKTINLPPVENYTAKEWIHIAKQKLVPLTGVNDGLFYDVLICNAYANQLRNMDKPLNNMQIKNISDYFKGNEFQKILFRYNQQVQQ